MSIKDQVQSAIKEAMKNREAVRLECLRLAKGALLVKEKESSHAKEDEAKATEQEIRVLEEFLPQQLSADQIEEKVRAYLAEHPGIDHAGKLTGALKKELGDQADGKLLNEICRKVLE